MIPSLLRLRCTFDGYLVLKNLSFTSALFLRQANLPLSTVPQAEHTNPIIQVNNPFAWNAVLKARLEARDPYGTVAEFKKMVQSGARPNGITFSFVARAFSGLRGLMALMGVHVNLLRLGFWSDAFALNTLLDGYLVCGSVDLARVLFDEMPVRNLVTWTVMMSGYGRSDRGTEAIELFFAMREGGIRPDGMALVAAFNACAQVGDPTLARKVEGVAFENDDVLYDIHVANSMIDMYAKCESIEDARKIFDALVDKDTITWNCMVSGYARSGSTRVAREIFDQTPNKNEVSWSALISGYVQNGEFMEALSAFQEMRAVMVVPNNAALTSAITACAHLGALSLGQQIHSSLDEHMIQNDVVLVTALVDMYAKCGCLEFSCVLFDRIVKKTLISWNVMIMAMATHGNASACFDLFSKLLRDGLRPNSETFLGILLGCAHAGLLNEGKNFFIRMTSVYGITPQVEHCSCMVHLIGQAGFLDQAFEFIKASSVTPDVTLWGALLTACNIHGNPELGEFVAERILELDPSHSGAYVQLSSLYSKAGMWRQAMDVRVKMKEKGIKNRPGWSSFEIDGTVHEFLVGDNSHPMSEEILRVLKGIDVLVGFTCHCQ